MAEIMDPGSMWVARAMRLGEARKPAFGGKWREQTTQQQGTWQVSLWRNPFPIPIMSARASVVAESGSAFQHPSLKVVWEGDTEPSQ